jgi:hypothetical protein
MKIKEWITWSFGCFLGLVPLGAWMFAQRLVGAPEIVGAGATRELLFFALATASTALLNLSDYAGRAEFQPWNFGGLVITILSALCYGEFLIGEALHAAMHVAFVYNVSVDLAVVAFVYGAIVQGIAHKRPAR